MDIMAPADDMKYNQSQRQSVNYNYGDRDVDSHGNELDDWVVKTPLQYQNPNSGIKSLTLPEVFEEYNTDKFPDNGAVDTFVGATLRVDQIKKYMSKQGSEMDQVLAKQQEAAGFKPAAKEKKKDKYETTEEPDQSKVFTLAQNLADIEHKNSQSIYDNSLKSL